MSYNNNFVTAIIPAHNEEKTIHHTINIAIESEHVDEIIVVSDGSTDNTISRAENYPEIKIVELVKNVGKGKAMQKGVENATGDIILFLDADLKGINLDHVKSLVEPVKNKEVVMCMACRDKATPRLNYFSRRYLTHIAGERAMRRFVWQQVPDKYKKGYMIETALNGCCRLLDQPIGDVFCPGLGIVKKEEKWGGIKSIRSRTRLICELILTNILLFANPVKWLRVIKYKKITRYKPWINPDKGI